MAMAKAVGHQAQNAAQLQAERVHRDGSLGHSYREALMQAGGANCARDLADAVHLFCALYGRHPGLFEVALSHCQSPTVRAWLSGASEAFERERLALVRLTAAVGPLPSTPGAAETESVLQAQRHAIETLARSERNGCALGAATALIADWPAIRDLFDRAAVRMGITLPPLDLPDGGSIASIINQGCEGMAAERALGFGSEQLLLQNRGLFDLLEARAAARADC